MYMFVSCKVHVCSQITMIVLSKYYSSTQAVHGTCVLKKSNFSLYLLQWNEIVHEVEGNNCMALYKC